MTDAFWLIPAVCVGMSIGMAAALLWLDRSVSTQLSIAFAGGPSAAREILGTIASSTLTLTGLVFSITIVVLQLTSSQFSPRVLRTFLQDRPTQVALGVFLATYVYALVALRAVRGEEGAGAQFVPGITIFVAFMLTLASVAMFVQYIHHIAQSVRAVSIIDRIAGETRTVMERRYPPEPVTQAAPPRNLERPMHEVMAQVPGVVTSIDVHGLVRVAADSGVFLRQVVPRGGFVPAGGALVQIFGDGDVDADAVVERIRLQRERDLRQDVAFGLRQLVDIAERALSPGINDPSTAVQCLDQIHDLLRRLGTRPFPTGVHTDGDEVPRLQIPEMSWEQYVQLGLDEIRHWGASSLQVHARIGALLDDLLKAVGEDRHAPLQRQLALLEQRAISDLPPVERR